MFRNFILLPTTGTLTPYYKRMQFLQQLFLDLNHSALYSAHTHTWLHFTVVAFKSTKRNILLILTAYRCSFFLLFSSVISIFICSFVRITFESRNVKVETKKNRKIKPTNLKTDDDTRWNHKKVLRRLKCSTLLFKY